MNKKVPLDMPRNRLWRTTRPRLVASFRPRSIFTSWSWLNFLIILLITLSFALIFDPISTRVLQVCMLPLRTHKCKGVHWSYKITNLELRKVKKKKTEKTLHSYSRSWHQFRVQPISCMHQHGLRKRTDAKVSTTKKNDVSKNIKQRR